jgi:hypothetical protein
MTTLLNFTKPAKVDIGGGFDGGPEGGYVPQMSATDAQRWKAKRFNAGKPNDRIELRKNFGSTQVFMIVALDGWDLSGKNEFRRGRKTNEYYFTDTRGLNVRMSMNGPLLMTFETFAEFNQIVEEARAVLLVDRAVE